jgi:hypothetical protein
MKNFLINIYAYKHHAKFSISAEDNAESVEKAILDKLGEKGVKWDYLGEMNDPKINRITYEEVIDDTRPLQTEKVLGVEVGTGVAI